MGVRGWQDEARRASAAARSAMKLVAAAAVTMGGAVLGAAPAGSGMAGAGCRRGRPRGVRRLARAGAWV